MPWWPSAPVVERLRAAGGAVLLACALLFAGELRAEGIDARAAHIEALDDGWAVNADFDIDFNPVLADAVQRGVALYFVVDLEVRRHRWYWFDERVLGVQHTARLSYNALTSQYRVVLGAGPLAQRFDDLAEAIVAIAHVRNWHVGERGLFQPGERYSAQVRMRLDVNQLPKPFQLNAITNREWGLTSDWLRFAFTP